MGWALLLIAASLVELHGPDGQVIWVNPDQVINIREPRGIPQGHWAVGTRCLVLTSDGKFFTTAEPCQEIRRKLEDRSQAR
jgi:hypothetical protein